MKLEWLETLLMVEKLGSFSEVAEMIPCSQSSVSRHIKSVEDELGLTIIRRSSNSNTVGLTPDGEIVMPIIRRIVGEYENLHKQAKIAAINKKTPLALGVDENALSYAHKGNVLSLLYLRFPDVLLTIKDINAATYMEQLVTGKIDAMLLWLPSTEDVHKSTLINHTILNCEPLGMQHLRIAFGENYAPEKRDSITFAELKDEHFIFHTDICNFDRTNDVGNRHFFFVQACKNNGFEPDMLIVERHLADIRPILAMHGKGVFPYFVPTFFGHFPGLRFLPVSDSPYYANYYLLSLKSSKNPGIKKFSVFMKESFAELSGENLRPLHRKEAAGASGER